MLNVAIVIFDDVEVLDFAGPFEAFAVVRDAEGAPLCQVYTVAEAAGIVSARNGLLVSPNYTLDTCPAPDVVVVPGGRGARTAMHSEPLLAWLRAQAGRVQQMTSVCTGAFVLARAGLLANLHATTFHTAFDTLRELEPTVTTHEDARFVDNGRVVTSAGVSAGIDMALYVVGKLFSIEQAVRTARGMEYDWTPEHNRRGRVINQTG